MPQMPVPGPGGVHPHYVGKAGTPDALAQDGFPDRGAADVAQAHDGDPEGGSG